MADIGSITGGVNGFFSGMKGFSGSGLIKWLVILAFIIAFMTLCGVLVYMVVMKKRYKQPIRIFESNGKKLVPVSIDWGWRTRLGNAGDYWMVWRKAKRITAPPTETTDFFRPREAWYLRREDGELINISLTNMEAEKVVKVNFKNQGMSYMRLAIVRNLKDELKGISLLKEYMPYIAMAIMVIVLVICNIVNYKAQEQAWEQIGNIAGSISNLNQATAENMEKVGIIGDRLGEIMTRTYGGLTPTTTGGGG